METRQHSKEKEKEALTPTIIPSGSRLTPEQPEQPTPEKLFEYVKQLENQIQQLQNTPRSTATSRPEPKPAKPPIFSGRNGESDRKYCNLVEARL